MIPNSTVVAFIIAAICTLVLPIVILVVLLLKKKINWLPLLVGVAAFFVSQIVLRIPILTALSGQEWYQNFAATNYIVFILLLSFSAGLFEESARLGGALLLKNNRTFKDIISFGLGHAFCEVIILIGISHVNNVSLCMTLNGNGGTSALPPEVLEVAAAQLAAVNPAHVYWGILERFSAVLFHLFATLLVFKGVIQKQWRYYVFAIITHTLFNFIGVLLTQFGVEIAEIVLLIMALAAGYYIIRSRGVATGTSQYTAEAPAQTPPGE